MGLRKDPIKKRMPTGVMLKFEAVHVRGTSCTSAQTNDEEFKITRSAHRGHNLATALLSGRFY